MTIHVVSCHVNLCHLTKKHCSFLRYSADYGMFKFCIADSEHDWRAGSEQYLWIEKCLASADRRKQPWLIFVAHRVLGYSSNLWYGREGSFEEPMGREHLQTLWQKYKVDIAFFGHVHNYERICPIYQVMFSHAYKENYTHIMIPKLVHLNFCIPFHHAYMFIYKMSY